MQTIRYYHFKELIAWNLEVMIYQTKGMHLNEFYREMVNVMVLTQGQQKIQ